MIKIDDAIVKVSQFGDGTLKCPVYDLEMHYFLNDTPKAKPITITWCYDDDSELFTLWCLVNELRQEAKDLKIILCLPYVPHARQDRRVSRKVFTLKYFAQLINQMNFEAVYVLDPHSDVTTALIDRVHCLDHFTIKEYQYTGEHLWKDNFKDTQIMYPDAGAAKKYNNKHLPGIIGIKHRNPEGMIDQYALQGLLPNTKTVIIRDDICSYGGTFVAAAKELRAKGVENIYLVVSHCENNILKGEVFNYIDEVWTTDSICTVTHPKLHVEEKYRTGSKYIV